MGESGGYGMLIGPHSSAEQRDEFKRMIEANPRNYIAQPTLDFSPSRLPDGERDRTPGTWTCGLISCNGDKVRIVPGGLTRVRAAAGGRW